MVSKETDDSPSYLSKKEREERKFHEILGTKINKMTKEEMKEALSQNRLKNPKGNQNKLQKLCQNNNICIDKEIQKIRKGWVNKQKGSLQVLYERGWINPDEYKEYTKKGKLDVYGNRDKAKSLRQLISMQPDFLHQETLLQIHCKKLGTLSNRLPIAHPKIAGEGIKFNWGFSKITYGAKPLSKKCNKTKFHELVHKVLGSAVLTLTVCQANARRARQYMLAYMTLEGQSRSQSSKTQHPTTENKDNQTTVKQEIKVTHTLIEKCVGLFRKRRMHRNAIDFDGQYLKDEVLKIVFDNISEKRKSLMSKIAKVMDVML